MNYIKVEFEIHPVQPGSDILIAYLNELSFESFELKKSGVDAFIQETLFNEVYIKSLIEDHDFVQSYRVEKIVHQNWNAVWEKEYPPVILEDLCTIRAPFHDFEIQTKYDIIIQPKMSFGTGHHPTTELMIREISSMELRNKDVLDMGSGTGVLAVLAEQMGASKILAVEIDSHAAENCFENIQTNNCIHVNVENGDVKAIIGRKFDVIFANINLNALLNDLEDYVTALNPGAHILFSGFYKQDEGQLVEPLKRLGLILVSSKYLKNWTVLHFQNISTRKDLS